MAEGHTGIVKLISSKFHAECAGLGILSTVSVVRSTVSESIPRQVLFLEVSRDSFRKR